MTMTNSDCAHRTVKSAKLQAMKPTEFVLWATKQMGSAERGCFERTWRNGGFTQVGYLARMGYGDPVKRGEG